MAAEAGAAAGAKRQATGELRADREASLAIAGVVAMSATLVNPAPAVLLPGLFALIVLLVTGNWPVRRGLRLAWRLKWFLLSLLFFFGWLAPDAGSVGWERVVPSLHGLADAGVRIGALVLVVFWVAWLTSAFDRQAQISGLGHWLKWLRPLGIRDDAFGRRLFLALDLFETQQVDYRGFRQRVRGSRWGRLRAGREFLIERLDHALAGQALPRRMESVATGAGRGSGTAVPWQVALLWLAVLFAASLRVVPLGNA